MTEINQSNGHRTPQGHGPLVPVQRPPQDSVPPGVWRGPVTLVPAPSTNRAQRRRLRIRVRAALTHPRTRTAARCAVRQGAYVLVGGRVLARRTWDARTPAKHERMMRAAVAAGDHANALEWEARAANFRKERHERRMAMLLAPVHAARAIVVGSALTLGGLLALGIMLAVTSKHIADVVGPLLVLVHIVRWCVTVGVMLWRPVALGMPVAALLALWAAGRHDGHTPAWLAPTAQAKTGGEPITPSIVVVALRDLGFAPLRAAIKEMGDAGAGMLGPIRIAGCGVEVDVTLPSGVSTAEIQKRRRTLAENLGRHEHELFITIPQAARTVRLWIADSGALDEPIGPAPLVTDATATADIYTGRAPWGVDLRGDAALVSLKQRMMLVTGLSNQGKTAALRALALWAALDRYAEFRIADLKGVGDWRMFDGLATILIQGPTDQHVIAATEMVEAAVAEMERRLVALERSGAIDGVTREMARSGKGFHPLILVIDEAQVAFMCPLVDEQKRPYGGQKATSRYFMGIRKLQNQGRAVNVVVWQGTQDPTDQNLPKLVREGAHIRASLVVGTEAQARMALGDKAIDGGAAPHKLRAGLDKGTLVVAGDGVALEPGQSSITIRTHYINGEDALEIARRAKALRQRVETRTDLSAEPEQSRDVLADIAAVLDDATRMRSEDVLHRLKNLAPKQYGAFTTQDLKAALEPYGAEARKYQGNMHISRARVQEALEERDGTSETTPGE